MYILLIINECFNIIYEHSIEICETSTTYFTTLSRLSQFLIINYTLLIRECICYSSTLGFIRHESTVGNRGQVGFVLINLSDFVCYYRVYSKCTINHVETLIPFATGRVLLFLFERRGQRI